MSWNQLKRNILLAKFVFLCLFVGDFVPWGIDSKAEFSKLPIYGYNTHFSQNQLWKNKLTKVMFTFGCNYYKIEVIQQAKRYS